jgi:hypothetical protein
MFQSSILTNVYKLESTPSDNPVPAGKFVELFFFLKMRVQEIPRLHSTRHEPCIRFDIKSYIFEIEELM